MERKLKNVKKPDEAPAQNPAERLNDIIKGNVEPPNEVVKYLVEKLRATKDEIDELTNSLAQARNAVASMEKRLFSTSGAYNKYIEDIRNWDKQVVPEAVEPEAVEPAAEEASGGE